MAPLLGMTMQRFVHTPLCRAIVYNLICALVLQPLWEVSQRTPRDGVPLRALIAWVLTLVQPGAAHATAPVADVPGPIARCRKPNCSAPWSP